MENTETGIPIESASNSAAQNLSNTLSVFTIERAADRSVGIDTGALIIHDRIDGHIFIAKPERAFTTLLERYRGNAAPLVALALSNTLLTPQMLQERDGIPVIYGVKSQERRPATRSEQLYQDLLAKCFLAINLKGIRGERAFRRILSDNRRVLDSLYLPGVNALKRESFLGLISQLRNIPGIYCNLSRPVNLSFIATHDVDYYFDQFEILYMAHGRRMLALPAYR